MTSKLKDVVEFGFISANEARNKSILTAKAAICADWEYTMSRIQTAIDETIKNGEFTTGWIEIPDSIIEIVMKELEENLEYLVQKSHPDTKENHMYRISW